MRFAKVLRRKCVGHARLRVRAARARFGLDHLAQIHHIYPREFRDHPSLLWIDIDAADNLVLMPTRRGRERLRLRPDRLIHDGGHHDVMTNHKS